MDDASDMILVLGCYDVIDVLNRKVDRGAGEGRLGEGVSVGRTAARI